VAIAIRPYRAEDRDATARLWLASWRSTGLAVAGLATEAANRERILLELATGWEAYLAWEEDRLVGFLALKPGTGCLDQLFVAPAAQGAGVGLALLGFAKERLPAGMWLRTAMENRRARRFYERNGFRQTATEKHPTLGHLTAIYCWP
jgi:ribosomal protein S18 acetylase RimI-like enzyme